MSTDSMFHWRHLGSVLRSDCRQRHRQCLESGPRFSLQCCGGVNTSAATCYHSSGENGPMSTPRRAHQDRTSSADVETHVQQQVAAVSLSRSTAVSRTWLPHSTTRDWRGSLPVFQHPNSNPHCAPGSGSSCWCSCSYFPRCNDVTHVFLGRTTPHSAGGRHGPWFVSCVGATAHSTKR